MTDEKPPTLPELEHEQALNLREGLDQKILQDMLSAKPPTTISFLGITCRRFDTGDLHTHRLVVSQDIRPDTDERLKFRARCRWGDVFGATLEECEKKLLAEIYSTERSVSYLCRRLQPLNPLDQACENFLDRWRQIPPLVRASYGYLLVERTMKEFPVLLAEKELAELLPRRDRVNQLFRQASSAFRMLAVDLTRQADDEAETAGIADVRYKRSVERPSVGELIGALHTRDVLPGGGFPTTCPKCGCNPHNCLHSEKRPTDPSPSSAVPHCIVCNETDTARRDGRCQNVPASSHTWSE